MISGILPYALPFLLIVFLPFLQDYYDTGRWVTMIGTTILLVSLWGYKILKTKKFDMHIVPVAYGFGALTLATIISTLFVSTNKAESIVHPLGLITYGCLFLITFLLPQLFSEGQKQKLLWGILAVIGLLGIIVIYQQFTITSIIFPTATFLKDKLWNPTGTPTSAIMLFLVGIPLGISLIQKSILEHKDKQVAFAIVCSVFAGVGCAVTIWRFIPMIQTVLMPISVGWTVLLEAYKSSKVALFGIGVDNFLSAYASGKPMWVNQTLLWNTVFSASATMFFHIATTLGFIGITGCIALFISYIRIMPKSVAMRICWIVTICMVILFPPSIPLLLFIALISVAVDQKPHQYHEMPSIVVVFLTIILGGSIIAATYTVYRFTYGEYLYAQARIAAETENNLTKSYNDHIVAIIQNPYMTRYHLSLSQLSLIMGGSILSTAPRNETTGVVTLLDEDKKLVTDLFSLAVSEAKLATTLSPNSYVVWVNLANVYGSLIGVAGDAETWTVAAYQKAVTLNPTNPTIRIDFGGVYMNAKEYDNAIQQFFTAITLRPGYANAYYNLANAYRLKGDTAQALKALMQTRDLIPKDGNDYMKVTNEISALENPGAVKSSLPTTSPPSEGLTEPVPTRIPLVIPELTVPQN